MVCLAFALVVFLKWYVLCYRLLMQFELFCYCPSWLRQLFQIFLRFHFRFESYFLFFDLTYDVFCQCPSWFFIFTAFWKLTNNSFCILTFSRFPLCLLLVILFVEFDDDLLICPVLFFLQNDQHLFKKCTCFSQPDWDIRSSR